jgi:hypothetical protein
VVKIPKRGLGESPLDWIGEGKEVKTPKRFGVKESKRRIKHTIYLSEGISKKLKHEAVEKNARISDLVEEILSDYLEFRR